MEDEREKFAAPADDGDEVEAHKFEPDLEKREKFATPADEGDDVEAHKF